MPNRTWAGITLVSLVGSVVAASETAPAERLLVGRKDDGYRGIWYANQAQDDEYEYKYSGGLGTYCAKHIPLACYAKEANKTFFVYGGTTRRESDPSVKPSLLAMVSYYDHATGQVPRPTILMDKQTRDAHDNPVLMLDDAGYVWVFVAAHGTARPAYIFKSVQPYDIKTFEQIAETNFSYPQPWYMDDQGFLFLHTRYNQGAVHRKLFWMTSPDGVTWSEPKPLAGIGVGHYQISWRFKDKVGTAFNYHPKGVGLNGRTNLYYMETRDFGKTWRNARGEVLELPLSEVDNPALVMDYEERKRLVYLKDLTFDPMGNPIILFVTSKGYEAGPKNGWRNWMTARWTRREWEITGAIRSDNNYDTGCLHVEKIDQWRMFAPTVTGPQPYNPGGEVAMWTTEDLGRSWYRKLLTRDSEFNHTYMRRPVNAHPGFYAYWADGHGRKPSASRLYFATKEGDVFRLPTVMTGDFAKPEHVPGPPEPPSNPKPPPFLQQDPDDGSEAESPSEPSGKREARQR